MDAFKTSRPWVAGERYGCWDCAGPLDADGWVRSLDATRPNGGQVARTIPFTDLDGDYPGGTYLVLYDGQGMLEYSSGATRDPAASGPGRDVVHVDPSAGDFHVALVATEPTDHIPNVRILMPGGVCADDPHRPCTTDPDCGGAACELFADHHASQVFHPTFLSNLEPFAVIRFMNWMRTVDSTIVHPTDYTRISEAQWTEAPIEIMVELANRLDADPWFTLPHQATDAFVVEFATRVQAGLDPPRRVHVEDSNEVWNSTFEEHSWVAIVGCRLHPDLQAGCDDDDVPGNGLYSEGHPWPSWNTSCHDAQTRRFSERSVEIWDGFAGVFGGPDRLVRVMASQTHNSRLHGRLLGWEDAWQTTDVLATAPYFGGHHGGDPAVASWSVNRLLTDLEQVELPAILGQIEDDAAYLASSYPSIELITYEGGQHLVGLAGLENAPAMNALFDAANRDPRMGELDRTYLDGWREAGGTLFVDYLNVGRWSKWGRWGALERQDQVPASSPRYQAQLDFIAENPCWWPGCALACTDADGDAYPVEGGTCGPVDCDDADPAVHPGAEEIPRNGIDDDCDPTPPPLGCRSIADPRPGDGKPLVWAVLAIVLGRSLVLGRTNRSR